MSSKYVIRWKSKVNGRAGRGTKQFERVEAERQRSEPSSLAAPRSKAEGRLVEGAGDFIASINTAPKASRPLLQRLSNWTIDLERERLVKLKTYHGKSGILTLLPCLVADDAGLVSSAMTLRVRKKHESRYMHKQH